MLFSSLPYGLSSGRSHEEPKLPIILNFLYFTNFIVIYPILTHPVNFPSGRKSENPEKTHDFRQSVDELFPREIRCSIQGSNLTTSMVGGGRLDDRATEVPSNKANVYLRYLMYSATEKPLRGVS